MRPEEIYNQMMEKDAFSQLLGMSLISISPGTCSLQVKVTGIMLNGFQIAHGGITYALSDSALAFASNAHGQQCVSIETSISHLQPIKLNDTIIAECTEVNRGNSIGLYAVNCRNQDGDLVSVFKGTVKISRSKWEK